MNASESSDDEPQTKNQKTLVLPKVAKKENSNDEDDSSKESSDVEPKRSKAPVKSSSSKDDTSEEEDLPRPQRKRLMMFVERPDVEEFFKDAGEVVDVRFSIGEDGRFRGFGHVEFDKSPREDEIRSALEEHFGCCGEITRVSIPKDYETGASMGLAYMDFSGDDGFSHALELNSSDINGYNIIVEEARPRGDNRDGFRPLSVS
ncbi:nucleolin 2-like [Aristolochia californica]|uniref:nucleolin 2-like n=1 Tax=Aristolochia californica TaxID=171875 RepID=UPI0035DA1367